MDCVPLGFFMGANPNVSDSYLITMNTSLIQLSTTSQSPLTTSYPPWIQMSTTTYDNYTHNMSDSMEGEVVNDTQWMRDVQYVMNYRVVVAIALLGIIGVKVSIVGNLRDREVACSASDRQGSNFESCVWRTVSSQSSHHPQEVLLA